MASGVHSQLATADQIMYVSPKTTVSTVSQGKPAASTCDHWPGQLWSLRLGMGDGDSALIYTKLDHTWFLWPRDLRSLENDVFEALSNTGVVAGRESRMLWWSVGQSRDSNCKLFSGRMSLWFLLGLGPQNSRHCTGLQNKAEYWYPLCCRRLEVRGGVVSQLSG